MTRTKIEWCDYTKNPVKGLCPMGCPYCYAAAMYKRFGWDTKIRYERSVLSEKLEGKPGDSYFIGSTMELFGPWIPPGWMREILAWTQGYPDRTFIFLSKFPEGMKQYEPYPNNVWLGVSITEQKDDWRIIELLNIKAAVHFISVEPMINRVDLTQIYDRRWPLLRLNALDGKYYFCGSTFTEDSEGRRLPDTRLSWVITGPQTGPRALPCQVDWVRDLQRQCSTAGVPFFDKRDMLGETIQEWPE